MLWRGMLSRGMLPRGTLSRRMPRHAALAAFVIATGGTSASTAAAQRSGRVNPSAAELAIAAGRFDLAEAALFEKARLAPRDPTARGALGAFLAARGKFLVGATLLEEALQFGGDTASIEARLLEIFRWSSQYERAAALPAARLAPAARTAMHRAAGTMPGGEASATVSLQPNDVFGLGRFTLVVGGERVEADIQPLLTGLRIPATPALFGAVEAVDSRGDTTYAVARSVEIGRVSIGPVPVELIPGIRTARIGLDVLGQLAPTIDWAARTLTVRSAGSESTGTAHSIFLTFPGVTVVVREGEPPVALHTAAGRALLRGRRWTLDLAAGTIVVEK